MPISATAVDCHRIACEAFEGPGGRDKSRFQNAARRRIAEASFDNPDEAFQLCNVSYDHWVSDGITEPSKLTSVIPLEAAKDWPVDTVDALPHGDDQGATIVAPSSESLDALPPGDPPSQETLDVLSHDHSEPS
jgi:hypothetical protein